jgi:hypothetical protein
MAIRTTDILRIISVRIIKVLMMGKVVVLEKLMICNRLTRLVVCLKRF